MARAPATDEAALVRAAARVFELKGYQNSTIDDIAEAARISRPTVYKYTRSKKWLLDRVVEELMEDLGARLDDVIDRSADPRSRLRQTILAHCQSAVENRTSYAIAFSEETELSDEVRLRFRSAAHEVTRNFKKLLDECRVDIPQSNDIDTWICANLILSTITSLHRWYRPGGPTSPDRLAEQIYLVAAASISLEPENLNWS